MNDPSEIMELFVPGATIDVEIPRVIVPLASYTVELADGLARRERNVDGAPDTILLQFDSIDTTQLITSETYASLMRALLPIPGVLPAHTEVSERGGTHLELMLPEVGADDLHWRISPDVSLVYLGRRGTALALDDWGNKVLLTHDDAWYLVRALATWNLVHLKLRELADRAFDAGFASHHEAFLARASATEPSHAASAASTPRKDS